MAGKARLLSDVIEKSLTSDEEKQETTPKTVLSDECPKCGKIVKRGKVMHQKYCKAKQ